MQEIRRIQLGKPVYSTEDGVTTTSGKPSSTGSSPSSSPASSQQSSPKQMPAIMMHNNKPILVNLTSATGSPFTNGKCVTLAPSQMLPLDKSRRISMITSGSVNSANGGAPKRIGIASSTSGITIGGNSRILATGSGNGSLAFPALKVIKSPLETNKSSPIDLLSTPITDFSSIRNSGSGNSNVSRPMFLQVVKPGSLTSNSSSSSSSNPTSPLTPASSPKTLNNNIEILSNKNNVFVATNSSSASSTPKSLSPVSNSDESSKKTSTGSKSGGRGSKKHPENHVKRPMNRFMVWSQIQRKKMFQHKPDVHNAQISKQLGEMWRKLSEAEREPFVEMAKQLEKEHAEKYPDYKYRPRKKASGQKGANGTPTKPANPNSTKTPVKSATPSIPNTPVTPTTQIINTPIKARLNISNSPFSNITVVNNNQQAIVNDQLMMPSPPSCSDGSIMSSSDVEIQDLLDSSPVGRKMNHSINSMPTNVHQNDSNAMNGFPCTMSMMDSDYLLNNERASGLLTPVSSMSDNANQDSMDLDLGIWDLETSDLMSRSMDIFDFGAKEPNFADLNKTGNGSMVSGLTSTLHNPMILLSDLASSPIDDEQGYFSPLFESPTPSSSSGLDYEDSLSALLDNNDQPADWLQADTLDSWIDSLNTAPCGSLSVQDFTYAPDDFP